MRSDDRHDANRPGTQARFIEYTGVQWDSRKITVFLPLDENGGVIGRISARGDYPTSVWAPGETLIEARSIELTDEALAKVAGLAIGLYRLADGTRLTALDATHTRLANDQIILPVRP
jgi:hypothetical protein